MAIYVVKSSEAYIYLALQEIWDNHKNSILTVDKSWQVLKANC